MSFYENQHRARRNTGLLVGYFVVAVLLITMAVNAALYLVFSMVNTIQPMTPLQWLQSEVCWVIAGGTLLVIAAGSLFRMAKLAKGGVAVALMAGGTPLDTNSRDLKERTLINVTEEMAIASGVRVPRIFVLRNEPGINAFVAGTDPGNTVLAVTQGALDTLTRDELQGVIGHEFSHILNGDMLLNVRLIGVLAGILLIGQIGEFLMRSQQRARSSRSKNGGQIAIVGLALMVIGYVGLFFGRLIKASISRQREFLADASSVQFTRNPDGIASALYAIGMHSGHSNLQGRHAEDMSHMCFGQTLPIRLGGMLATHPPIESRIKAIDPGLLPRLKARWRKRQQVDSSAPPVTQAAPSNAAGFAGDSGVALTQQQLSAIKASVGNPTPAHAEFAHQLHEAMPAGLVDAAHDPASASSLLFALLLTEMNSHGKEFMTLVKDRYGQESAQATANLYQSIRQHDLALRLPLLDIALATLRDLEAGQREQLVDLCDQLIRIDNKVTLSEFIITYLVRQLLCPASRPQRTIKSFRQIESSLAILFSTIAQSSGHENPSRADSFRQVMKTFTQTDWSQLLQSMPTPRQITAALDQLARLTPLLKQSVVDGCVDCILHDGKATLRELEILRALCAAMECPMPPLQVTLPVH